MSNLLFLKQWNNYYNRRINTSTNDLSTSYILKEGVNFNPNDDIDTELVINWSQEWIPDYMLLLSGNMPIIPASFMDGMTLCSIRNADQQVYSVSGTAAEVQASMATNRFFDLDSKELNLSVMANYENGSYGTVYIDIEGSVDLDKFYCAVPTIDGMTIRIWSDDNDLTITSSNMPGGGVLNKASLESLGWTDNEAVWGITITGASPDVVWGLVSTRQIPVILTDQKWFVTDCVRTRKGQYNIKLHRDIVSDSLRGLSTGVFSVDRCKLSSDNPLIFNKEGFEYNQIKKDEYLISDRTNTPWIVGYIAENANSSHSISFAEDYDIDLRNTSFANWQYATKLGTNYGPATVTECKIGISYENDWWTGGYTGCFIWNGPSTNYTETVSGNNIGLNNEMVRYSESNYNTVKSSYRVNWWNWSLANDKENQAHVPGLTATQITDLRSYNGKKILFSDGVYLISFTNPYDTITTYTDNENELTQYIVNTLASHSPTGTVKHRHLEVYKTRKSAYVLSYNKVADITTISWKLPSTANTLTDAPYKMFCLPLPLAGHNVYVDNHLQDKDVNLQVAMDILANTTQGQIYDVQVLPYCPIEFASYSAGTTTTYLTSPSGIQDVDYSLITNTHTEQQWVEDINDEGYYEDVQVTDTIGRIYFPKTSSFKFTTTQILKKNSNGTYSRVNISVQPYLNGSGETKILSEQQFIRLCDSTYTSVFEMSPVKNGGINSFNMFCTYKPYNPYILVAPNFGNLYGNSYEDSRGLLCLGDYSLPNTDTAWQQYELNNKTYQQSFNREITHMEKEFAIQRQEAGWQIAAGTVEGTMKGLQAGMMTGNPYVAAGMAIAGGASSLAGGIMDYNNLGKRQKEEINYRKDMFNFSLQNIKAMPNTLTKTSAIVANTKYLPFIECYDATDEERDILRQYIEYNGMKAGYVGSINASGFVRANIIKYNESLPAHEVDALNTELTKGVYFE